MQTRRTDDPAEKDRSASYSIKQPKTYTWKQGGTSGPGSCPEKPEQPRAKTPKPNELKEPSTPDGRFFYGLSLVEFVQLAYKEASDGSQLPQEAVR